MRTLFIAARALTFMSGFVLLWGWIAVSVRSYDRDLGIVMPAWTEALGILFMLIGGALALTCVGTFVVRGQGTPAPFDPPERFVAAGPYRWVRNPMYIGGLTVLAGFGLYQHSISILVLCVVFFLAAHLFVVWYEEPNLRKRSGTSYEDYCKTVARWTPKL